MKIFLLFVILFSCSRLRTHLNRPSGSYFKTSELRRNPVHKFNVRIEGRVHKRVRDDFYLVKDEEGLILVEIKEGLLGLDTDYNKSTRFEIRGVTNNNSEYFYIKANKVKRLN